MNENFKTAIVGATLFNGEDFVSDSALLICDEKITGIAHKDKIPEEYSVSKVDGGVLAPGFIDLQVNGGGGVLFNNQPTTEAIKQIIEGHQQHGVTSLLATLISDDSDTIQQGLEACIELHQQAYPGLLGIHVEGPFFSEEKRGAHHEEKIRTVTESDEPWLNKLNQLPAILTLAPDNVCPQGISRFVGQGIRVCIGHSNATNEQTQRALAAGASGFTHLYNAMSPFAGREPGVTGTALLDDKSYAGIIVDGHHVHKNSILLALKCKGRDKLFFVSDAMATVGGNATEFDLYGEKLVLENGRLVNAEGNLAGAAISMSDAVKLGVNWLGLSLEDCLIMASTTPAHYIQQQHHLGYLKPEYFADLVWLDDELSVRGTWVRGKRIK